MKTSYKYLAIIFVTLLCSCDKEVMPDFVESQVEISANITPCVLTRVTDDGIAFTDGDNIRVQNMNRAEKNLATYAYSESTSTWNTSDALYWGVQPTNTFNAWYPATSAYNLFTIPTDQTAGTATADWMTATTSANRANGAVNLSFNHNLAKVTITIDEWNNEYLESERVISLLELSSLSGVMSYDSTLSGDNQAKWVKTYTKDANKSFVAIIAPGTYASATNIMQVYVNGSATPLAVKTPSNLTLEVGKAYRFKLTIGKDLATITSSVTVGDWGDVDLEDNNAQQQ